MTKFRFSLPTVSLLLLVWGSLTPALSQNVLTNRYDVGRLGQDRAEKALTTSNVNSSTFGKLFSYSVDGQIYAQPLYVSQVNIPGQGQHNVVYVATQMDSVYAFDADGLSSTPLWQDSFIDLANGIGPVPCGSAKNTDISCGVYPIYGISGTPVIDINTHTMYLVARTYDMNTGNGFQQLHALDLATGAEKFGGPVLIQGSVPGTGTGSHHGVVAFNPLADIQRTGLLLLNDNIYIGWAGAAHGWVMAYDAQALTQKAIFNSTPDAVRGGVWQSGNALAADSSGDIYLSTGDALFDANTGGADYGDSLLKFDANLNVVDYFTPMDQACRYTSDFDLSSSGPMVLPSQGGSYPDEVITSGKGGNPCDSSGFSAIYVADQNNLGKYDPQGDQIIQEISGSAAGYWSSAAYWNGGSQPTIYYAGINKIGGTGDNLKMYSLTKGLLSTAPVAQSPNIFASGTTPTVSSNGVANGIVWAIERQEGLGVQPGQMPAILYAYDATNVSTVFYNSIQNAVRDQGGCANKMQVPTIASGKVYVGTQNELDIFGLLGTPPSAPAVYLSKPCHTFNKQPVGTTSASHTFVLTNSGTAALNIGGFNLTGLQASEFTATNNCPAALAVGKTCAIKVTFTPAAAGPRAAQLIITDNAGNSPQNIYLVGRGT